ncbi:MAG TPA: GNAT family N-acetyltransferase [Anaerolineae bacterium]|nr:GNAT family N-acetyltransferase [Anaerolineae bacterium]
MLAGLVERDTSARGLRAFNPLLDLRPTTELIELAFGEALDPLSRETLQEMRALAWLLGPLFWLLSAIRSPLADTYSGYVWVEESRIVGNVTVHRRHGEKQGWFISNVAVHPDHRHKGIARHLVTAGLEMARQRGAQRISLEVRANNVTARKLYEDLGFREVDSASRMRMYPLASARPVRSEGYTIEMVRPDQWPRLLQLTKDTLSPEAREIMPGEEEIYRRSGPRRLVSGVGELLNGRTTYRLAAEKRGEIAGVITVRTGGLLRPHVLNLMVHPAHRCQVEEMLLTSALSALKTDRSRDLVAKIHPSYDHARRVFTQYGFAEEETLKLLTLSLKDE